MNQISTTLKNLKVASFQLYQTCSNKTIQWYGHGLKMIRLLPQQMQNNPQTALAVIVATNSLFFISMSLILNSLNKRLEKKGLNSEQRSVKNIFLNVVLLGSTALAFNAFLAKQTHYPLPRSKLAYIISAMVFSRILLTSLSQCLTKKKVEVTITNIPNANSPVATISTEPKKPENLNSPKSGQTQAENQLQNENNLQGGNQSQIETQNGDQAFLTDNNSQKTETETETEIVKSETIEQSNENEQEIVGQSDETEPGSDAKSSDTPLSQLEENVLAGKIENGKVFGASLSMILEGEEPEEIEESDSSDTDNEESEEIVKDDKPFLSFASNALKNDIEVIKVAIPQNVKTPHKELLKDNEFEIDPEKQSQPKVEEENIDLEEMDEEEALSAETTPTNKPLLEATSGAAAQGAAAQGAATQESKNQKLNLNLNNDQPLVTPQTPLTQQLKIVVNQQDTPIAGNNSKKNNGPMVVYSSATNPLSQKSLWGITASVLSKLNKYITR